MLWIAPFWWWHGIFTCVHTPAVATTYTNPAQVLVLDPFIMIKKELNKLQPSLRSSWQLMFARMGVIVFNDVATGT